MVEIGLLEAAGSASLSLQAKKMTCIVIANLHCTLNIPSYSCNKEPPATSLLKNSMSPEN